MVKPKTMKASEFKAKCLQVMDEVAATGEPVIITKNGKPVSKLVAAEERPATLFGALKGTGEILGDIVGPLGIDWEAESAHPRHPRFAMAHVRKPGSRKRSKKDDRQGKR